MGNPGSASDSELSWKWALMPWWNIVLFKNQTKKLWRLSLSVFKGRQQCEHKRWRTFWVPWVKTLYSIREIVFTHTSTPVLSYFIAVLHVRIECIAVAQPSNIKCWNSRLQLWRFWSKCGYICWIWWFPPLASSKLFDLSQMNKAL